MTYIVFSNRESPRCKVRIGDAKIYKVLTFTYLENALRDYGQGPKGIRKGFWIAKDVFQKLNSVWRFIRISLETTRNVLSCHVTLFFFLY